MERVYLVGHSMGGFTALNALAQGAKVRGAIVIAPCDMGRICEEDQPKFRALMATQKSGYFRIPTETYLEEDVKAHAPQWRFDKLELPVQIPMHFIGGTQDTMTPPEFHILPLYEQLRESSRNVTYKDIGWA